jgi:hypothetical protein
MTAKEIMALLERYGDKHGFSIETQNITTNKLASMLDIYPIGQLIVTMVDMLDNIYLYDIKPIQWYDSQAARHFNYKSILDLARLERGDKLDQLLK